jgi:hypothetical protein
VAAGVGRGFEPLAGGVGDRVLRVRLVPGPGQQDDAGASEAGEVVDVPVGLVLVDAAPQPDDLLGAEVFEQRPLDPLPAASRVRSRMLLPLISIPL